VGGTKVLPEMCQWEHSVRKKHPLMEADGVVDGLGDNFRFFHDLELADMNAVSLGIYCLNLDVEH
jgi:hypothetical protein